VGFDMGVIIALALSATSALSKRLRIPKKLRGWTAMFLIVVLHMANRWIYDPAFHWKTVLLEAVSAAVSAVGLHSTAKNSLEQWTTSRRSKRTRDQADTQV